MVELEVIIDKLKNSTRFEEIDEVKEYIAELIPAVKIMFNFDQQNSAHQYNLWAHSVHTVLNLPRNLDDNMLYLAALLHDIGKPVAQCDGNRPDDTNKHYHGHPQKGVEIVRDEVIPQLEEKGVYLSETDKHRLLYYIEHHDDFISDTDECIDKFLKLGKVQNFKNLLLLEIADAQAHVMIPMIQKRIEACEKVLAKFSSL